MAQVNTQSSTATHKAAVFYSRASINTDFKHPLQKRIDFVFCDALPNANKQAVPVSEFGNVVTSSLYTPVKINFDGDGPTGHVNTEPIGPITSMRVEEDKVIGSAVIWMADNEDIIDWMTEASAEEDGVQFSWEVYYSDSKIDANGIEWLYDIVSNGIAIVANPAYEGRTPLLSMAEKKKIEGEMKTDPIKTEAVKIDAANTVKTDVVKTDTVKTDTEAKSETMDDLYAQVQQLTDRMYTMMEALYAALDEVKPQVDVTNIETDFKSLLDKLQGMSSKLSEATMRLSETEQELAELREFKQAVESAAQRKEVLAARRETMVAAGIQITDEAFDKRADTIASMSDEVFVAYLADLVDLVSQQSNTIQNTAQVKTQASGSSTQAGTKSIVPDPFHSQNDGTITIQDIVAALKNQTRTTRKVEDILTISS